MINHSPLGFVQARAGGLPLKLTYFISPQDKIDMSTKSFRILNASTINENNLGVYATIGIGKEINSKFYLEIAVITNCVFIHKWCSFKIVI